MSATTKRPSFLAAIVPLIALVGLLALNVVIFSDDASYGPNQIALILCTAIAGLIAIRLGFKWKDMLAGMSKSISSTIPAIMILLLIGALTGTWLISGVIPTMVYYGLDILHPSIFLFAACAISSLVSLATGSSWSTVGTVGVAMLGIGQALGFSDGIIAGAIISGAYFGDKMSPLSDTTNLAPAMAGTDLFTHIRHMAWTTVPSITIALILFLILGFNSASNYNPADVELIQSIMAKQFNINPVLFLVPVGVIALIYFKVPAIPALLAGTLLGGVFALIFQPEVIVMLSGVEGNYLKSSYMTVNKAMFTGLNIETGNEVGNKLLQSKGMEGMLNTIWLIVSAMSFGGIMEKTGMLGRLTEAVLSLVRSTGSLIASTVGTCLFFNATASDQYLAIVVPGRMFSKTYRDRGLKPENLSRTLEDSGTVTSALIPWNTCGAYHASTLQVATGEYWMFAFFNLISPVMTTLFGFMGWKVNKYAPEELKALEEESAREEASA